MSDKVPGRQGENLAHPDDPLDEGAVALGSVDTASDGTKMGTGIQPAMDVSEGRDSIFVITLGPLIWVVHFLASYLTNAIYCAKYADSTREAGVVQLAILAYTVVALPLIALSAWYGYRRHRYEFKSLPHDADTREDRFRFLGYASFLLALLSAVAVIFTALVAVFIGSCD